MTTTATLRTIQERLRPFGSVFPEQWDLRSLRAFLRGVRDGWRQPRELSTSSNVDDLLHYVITHRGRRNNDPYFAQDQGINLGQWLRSPLNHQQMPVTRRNWEAS
jgi:hypothetical protein